MKFLDRNLWEDAGMLEGSGEKVERTWFALGCVVPFDQFFKFYCATYPRARPCFGPYCLKNGQKLKRQS